MERKRPNRKSTSRETIDAAIAKSHSYDEFLSIMKKNYLKASPLGCMDNLRQNDWFGFLGRLRFYRLPLQLFVLGQRLYGAAFHGAFVGQETNAGPVGRIDIGGKGVLSSRMLVTNS